MREQTASVATNQAAICPLGAARDLREVRQRLRNLGKELRMPRRALYEFMSACTAVARSLMHAAGCSTFRLDVAVEGARVGMRATFTHEPAESTRDRSRAMVRALMSGLPTHQLEDLTQLIDQVTIGQGAEGELSASIIRWVR